LDDIEDVNSVKTIEGRNKLFDWFTREIAPLGDIGTRIMMVGNFLHDDSLVMRLKDKMDKGELKGLYRWFPLIKDGKPLWPEKFDTPEKIEELRQSVVSDLAWRQEYLLENVPRDEQVIRREWIKYYDELPDRSERDEFGYTKHASVRIGIDPAISQQDTADYTAMVPGLLFGDGKDTKVYILPDIVNRRITFPETIDLCKALERKYTEGSKKPTFIVEIGGYQAALPQQLKAEGFKNVQTVHPGSKDKRTRLYLTANMIKEGRILFPRSRVEALLNQMIHFGVEKHDDLSDAFVNLVLSVVQKPPVVPRYIPLY
jgi:predicted phage terminase large subunit-like protein